MNPSDQAATANPTMGSVGHAPVDRGIIQTLIESARRQERLIDLLTEAVESGDETSILQAARNLTTNRSKKTKVPSCKPGRKKKSAI